MPDQFQVRYARGVGSGSLGTPLFELYRLGGGDTIRGMESGEFVGRNFSWEQSEFGYNLFEPLDAISRLWPKPKPAPGAPAPPSAPTTDSTPSGISGFLRQQGINTLLLKVAHDRGLVTNDGRGFGDLFSLQHAAQGWGVGLELGGLRTPAGNVSLSLLRAKSSASYVHRNGVWATGVTLSF
jgi:hypothetical protein